MEKVTLCAGDNSQQCIVREDHDPRFELAGDKVRNIANTLIQLIAEGTGEDEEDEGEDGEGGEDEQREQKL